MEKHMIEQKPPPLTESLFEEYKILKKDIQN